jgi:hypothetical protein
MQRGSTNTWIVVGFIVALAGLDLVGAVLAKEWNEHREPWQLAGSAVAFLLLFVVFVSGLAYTEMSILTFGWIVVLETAVIMIDWARYGVTMTPSRWAAVAGIVALQAYLLLGSPATDA